MGNINLVKANNSRKLTVCAYARISRKTDRIEDSFSFQSEYWTNKLSTNPDYNFIGVFGDKGVSGRKTTLRKQFTKMIDLACSGGIDIIFTKSIQRFGRNIEHCIDAINKLKDAGVRVIFESDNIDTWQIGKDFALKCKIITADREAAQMSEIMRLKMNRDMKSGKVARYWSAYGYDINKQTGQWTINAEQAEVVRKIYQLYIEGHGGVGITKVLYKQGHKTPTGLDLWSKSTIDGILHDERYIGNEVLQKTYVQDGKQKNNNGEKPKYLIENHHEPIISKEVFERVQQLKKERYKDTATKNTYPLSKKIKCGQCGTNYRRVVNKKIVNFDNVLWDCAKSNRLGKEFCKGGRITDVLLKEMILTAYNEYISTPITETKQESINIAPTLEKIEEYKNLFQNGCISHAQYTAETENLERQLEAESQKLIETQGKVGYVKQGLFAKKYSDELLTTHMLNIKIQDCEVTITFNNGQAVKTRKKKKRKKANRKAVPLR